VTEAAGEPDKTGPGATVPKAKASPRKLSAGAIDMSKDEFT
jgi:hypothetical protein